jgi:hypothetical protein
MVNDLLMMQIGIKYAEIRNANASLRDSYPYRDKPDDGPLCFLAAKHETELADDKPVVDLANISPDKMSIDEIHIGPKVVPGEVRLYQERAPLRLIMLPMLT